MTLEELRELAEVHLISVDHDTCVTTSDDSHDCEIENAMDERLESLIWAHDRSADGYDRFRTGSGGANVMPDGKPLDEAHGGCNHRAERRGSSARGDASCGRVEENSRSARRY